MKQTKIEKELQAKREAINYYRQLRAANVGKMELYPIEMTKGQIEIVFPIIDTVIKMDERLRELIKTKDSQEDMTWGINALYHFHLELAKVLNKIWAKEEQEIKACFGKQPSNDETES
jgi:hypothetical protein